MRLAYLFSFGYRPDAVINLDGFNEVANGYQNALRGTNPLYPTPPVWAGVIGPRDLDDWQAFTGGGPVTDAALRLHEVESEAEALAVWGERGLTRSSLAGSLLMSKLGAVRREYSAAAEYLTQLLTAGRGVDRQLVGPDYPVGLEDVIAMCVTNWFESSVSIGALCDSRGVYYLHCLQPTLHDSGSKPLTDEEERLVSEHAGWQPGVEAGYPLLKERGELLRARGIAFVDTSHCLKDATDTLYYDPCHIIPEGNAIASGALAQAFLTNLP